MMTCPISACCPQPEPLPPRRRRVRSARRSASMMPIRSARPHRHHRADKRSDCKTHSGTLTLTMRRPRLWTDALRKRLTVSPLPHLIDNPRSTTMTPSPDSICSRRPTIRSRPSQRWRRCRKPSKFLSTSWMLFWMGSIRLRRCHRPMCPTSTTRIWICSSGVPRRSRRLRQPHGRRHAISLMTA